jgi:hypothetical protein
MVFKHHLPLHVYLGVAQRLKHYSGSIGVYIALFSENTLHKCLTSNPNSFARKLGALSLEELVELAHTRWGIERFYQGAKGELGPDHYEGEGFPGPPRHVAMSMPAYGLLLPETPCRKKTCGLALPELRRAIEALTACGTWIFPVWNRGIDYSLLSRRTPTT